MGSTQYKFYCFRIPDCFFKIKKVVFMCQQVEECVVLPSDEDIQLVKQILLKNLK